MEAGERALSVGGLIARPEGSSLLWALLRVNGLQVWRRLHALRHQSQLPTLLVAALLGGYLTMPFG